VEHYEPTDTGESPLASIDSFVNTTCPRCGKPAKRETDTMPNWAGSSWYFLRYADPHNDKEFASSDKLSYWLPVDWYNGGMEHTTLHLLYSRFWHKFLYDCGLVPTPEPYRKRTSHGMILGEDNEKMSKSRGNVVNPDDLVRKYGADTFRVYEMFLGAFDQASPWSQQGVKGCRRFLDRVWRLQDMVVEGNEYSPKLETLMHQTAKKISDDIERMKFNTAIAALMTLVNAFYEREQALKAEFRDFLILLNPFAPHISEELWERMGFAGRISDQRWVQWDESKAIEDTIDIPIQVNGKIRGTVTVARNAEKEEIRRKAANDKAIAKFISDRQVVKEVYVPAKIYSIVVK
jgi:leucyl-tRNA synthetase